MTISLILFSCYRLFTIFRRRWTQYQRRRTPQSYSRCLSISSEAYWVARWDNFLLLHSNRNCISILTFVSPSRLMWSKMWYSRKRMCDSKTKTDDFICFPAHRWSSKTRSDSTVTKTDDQSWKSDNNRFVRLQHLFFMLKTLHFDPFQVGDIKLLHRPTQILFFYYKWVQSKSQKDIFVYQTLTKVPVVENMSQFCCCLLLYLFVSLSILPIFLNQALSHIYDTDDVK